MNLGEAIKACYPELTLENITGVIPLPRDLVIRALIVTFRNEDTHGEVQLQVVEENRRYVPTEMVICRRGVRRYHKWEEGRKVLISSEDCTNSKIHQEALATSPA